MMNGANPVVCAPATTASCAKTDFCNSVVTIWSLKSGNRDKKEYFAPYNKKRQKRIAA